MSKNNCFYPGLLCGLSILPSSLVFIACINEEACHNNSYIYFITFTLSEITFHIGSNLLIKTKPL